MGRGRPDDLQRDIRSPRASLLGKMMRGGGAELSSAPGIQDLQAGSNGKKGANV